MIGMSSNKLADQLSTMPDQALPRMAQQYKDDAITLSMILNEKNRRDRVRQTGAAQQAQQPQAKINDQVVASMQPMPETVGIGALPAPNMQGMAEGGIIAFGDGGDVPGFADGVYIGEGGQYSAEPLTAEELGQRDPYARLRQFSDWAGRNVERDPVTGEVVRKSDAAVAATPVPAVVTPGVTPTGGIRNLTQPTTAVSPPAVTPAPGAGGPRASVAAAAPRAPVVPEKDYLTQLNEMGTKAGAAVDPNKAEREAITAEDVKGRRQGIAALKTDQAADLAAMSKGKEERISKREAELGKSKDTNTGMAFLEAGLAMMQARGPGLAGIAQGAGIGLKQYQSGIKDIRAAQEKLDDARDRMEELRQNREAMNKSEIRAEESKIRDTVVAGKRDILAGAEKATGVQRDDFRAAVASNLTRAEAEKTRATQIQAANIAAAPGLERNKILAASRDDQAKVRTEYGKLQAKVMSDLAKEPTYQMATPAEKSQMSATRLREALQNNPFLSAYAAGVGFSSAPANSTVRTLDED